MAKIDFDIEDDIKTGKTGNSTADINTEKAGVSSADIVDENIDCNDITVADVTAPIIMLFGPRSSGKTMTLVRLSRYLRAENYNIVVDDTFKSDSQYKRKCQFFEQSLGKNTALLGRAVTDFWLLKVVQHGRTICQFLEAPGEHYFDSDDISASNFPPYMTQKIRNLPNRKIWVFICEAEWDVNARTKKAYVDRIRNCKDILMHPTDRSLILYNKIDQKPELYENGRIHFGPVEKAMRQEFKGLADVFENTNPITRLWRPYNYKFVPFCTGYYIKDKGELTYTQSEDSYTRFLWEALMKCIRG